MKTTFLSIIIKYFLNSIITCFLTLKKIVNSYYSNNNDNEFDLLVFKTPFDSNPLSYPIHKEIPFFLDVSNTTKEVCIMYMDIQLHLTDNQNLNAFFLLEEKIKKEQNKKFFNAQYYACKNPSITDKHAKSMHIHGAFIIHASLYLVIHFLSYYLNVNNVDLLREKIRVSNINATHIKSQEANEINEVLLEKEIYVLKENFNLKEIEDVVVVLFTNKDMIEIKVLTSFLNRLQNYNKALYALNVDDKDTFTNENYLKDCKKIFNKYNLMEDPKDSIPLTLQHHIFLIMQKGKYEFLNTLDCWSFMILAQIISHLEIQGNKIQIYIPPLPTSSIILDLMDDKINEYIYLGYIFRILTGIFAEAIINNRINIISKKIDNSDEDVYLKL